MPLCNGQAAVDYDFLRTGKAGVLQSSNRPLDEGHTKPRAYPAESNLP
jgi:hypothetical protein